MSYGDSPGRLVGSRWIGAAIWALLASIFLFDLVTHPENVSACFAYTIPIFASLFERRPRPILYAGMATILSLVGSFGLPSGELPVATSFANRLIAIATQWLAAMLVSMHYRHDVETQREAEFQRRFVDILSHEVGTALTAITGHGQRLIKLSGRLAPGDLTLRVEKILDGAKRIKEVVDRMQFASSLGGGAIPVQHRAIDINLMIQQLTDRLKEERPGSVIEWRPCPEPLLVNGDEALLRSAFENIMTNSIRYSSCDRPIVVSTARRGAVVDVAIADCGRGIAKEELSRVREPYYRGSSSKGTSGTGLGLYFVERVVEAHKGTICIESELGRGTKVTIGLPQGKKAVM